MATLSARQMGAERIIVMSRNPVRQRLARAFGATEVLVERGEEGIEPIKAMTDGFGADSVMECVAAAQSLQQAMAITRPGGYMSFVGVPHGVEIEGQSLFFSHIHLEGGPAPVGVTCQNSSTHPRAKDQSCPSVRSGAAAGAGGGRLQSDGRTARSQGAAAAVRIAHRQTIDVRGRRSPSVSSRSFG